MGNARPVDGRPQSEVQGRPDKLEVVASFCYVDDILSAGGGCKITITTPVKTAWTTSSHIPLPLLQDPWPCIQLLVRSAMLHASETWQLTKTNLQCLQCNDGAMIRQIYSIKPEDVATVRSSQLLAKLELKDLNLILRERRLRWFRHVEGSSGAVRTACDIQIDCYACSSPVSYLEGGPLMWMIPLHLHVNQKSDYDDMMTSLILSLAWRY